jgi:hypothetical protein
MTLSRRELALISQLYRRAPWCSHPIPARVIPGRDEVASPESIHPPAPTLDGFRARR